jgi:hypothetical protein
MCSWNCTNNRKYFTVQSICCSRYVCHCRLAEWKCVALRKKTAVKKLFAKLKIRDNLRLIYCIVKMLNYARHHDAHSRVFFSAAVLKKKAKLCTFGCCMLGHYLNITKQLPENLFKLNSNKQILDIHTLWLFVCC